MPKRDLLAYWPLQEDVFACVKTDAEASSEAVSLAVHQPMRFERRVIGGETGSLSDCDEHELLDAFLTQNLPDGRVIVPIVGSSGIGKSHVVRWLDAQIRRMDGYNRRVVIRIPKGTSLKGVLSILLRDLQGSDYDQYRQELMRAQEELDPEEAAGLLCEMLAFTLGEFGNQARERLLANPGDRNALERDAYCRADMLPALLRNQFLRDHHFVRTSIGGVGVIKRLVEQLTEGRAAGIDDDRQHLFTPEDLLFSSTIDREGLGRAEIRAIAQLGREDRRAAAALILNAALDDAKQRLLRLDPTVSDLFNAVREQLLKERKELVLLVEDFAVLSGIQKQLLQVIIKEAFRDGRQVLCTMRTALAYTTGYMDTATVLTRANVEYRIPDEPGTEENILSRINRLVGAYLNAARVGQVSLERAYKVTQATANRSEQWIPAFKADIEHEARATLDDFGKSVDGYELFPLNHSAICELSREGCVQAGRLHYNPRFVIQNVINKVLGQRDLFEQGEFPPASFRAQGRPLPTRVVEEVKRRVPIRELDRYLRFLSYWGGFPSSLWEIVGLESRVFAAFGFNKSLFGRDVEAPTSQGSRSKPDTAVPPPDSVSTRKLQDQDPIETKWEKLLESWRGGLRLPQSDANQLRKWIAEALKGFVDWDWELYRPLKNFTLENWFEWIYIPQAAGNQGRTADEAIVSVCLDSHLLDAGKSAAVQSALMALIRFHGIHKCSWDYAEADADLPRYAALLESLADRARSFARRRYFRADWDPVPALVQGLLIGARVLGIDAATKDRNHTSLIQSLFIQAPEVPSMGSTAGGGDTDGTGWTEFTDAARRCRRTGEKESRDQSSWQGHLLDLVGARQGQADTVHAVDVMRLKTAIEETVGAWEFGASLPNPAGVPDFAPFRTTYVDLKRYSAAIPKAQQKLFRWRNEAIAWLGDDTDKDILVRELKETIDAARTAGVAGGLDAKGLLQLVEAFRTAKIKAALDDAAKLQAGAPRGLVLTILGRGHESVAQLCEGLKVHLENFLQAVEAELASESIKYGDDPVDEAVTSLTKELRELSTVLEGLEAL